jgi:hypothetical protein
VANHLVEAENLIAINHFHSRWNALDRLVGEQSDARSGADGRREAEALHGGEALANP